MGAGEQASPVIVFADVETTSLRPDRRAWDVAVIARWADPDVPDKEQQWFVDLQDLDLGNADPRSLSIGGFHDRHPGMKHQGVGQQRDTQRTHGTSSEVQVAFEVERLTRGGAVLVGSNPAFDELVLAGMLRRSGLCPSWYYHPTDFQTLIVGWLRGRGVNTSDLQPPWHTEVLSEMIGVDPPAPGLRHTALADAAWARRVWDKIMHEGDPGFVGWRDRKYLTPPQRLRAAALELVRAGEASRRV